MNVDFDEKFFESGFDELVLYPFTTLSALHLPPLLFCCSPVLPSQFSSSSPLFPPCATPLFPGSRLKPSCKSRRFLSFVFCVFVSRGCMQRMEFVASSRRSGPRLLSVKWLHQQKGKGKGVAPTAAPRGRWRNPDRGTRAPAQTIAIRQHVVLRSR